MDRSTVSGKWFVSLPTTPLSVNLTHSGIVEDFDVSKKFPHKHSGATLSQRHKVTMHRSKKLQMQN